MATAPPPARYGAILNARVRETALPPSYTISGSTTEAGLELHAFPWAPEAGDAGLARDAAYLVRPDGHVSVASADQQATPVLAVMTKFGVRDASGNNLAV